MHLPIHTQINTVHSLSNLQTGTGISCGSSHLHSPTHTDVGLDIVCVPSKHLEGGALTGHLQPTVHQL